MQDHAVARFHSVFRIPCFIAFSRLLKNSDFTTEDAEDTENFIPKIPL
jgi:hypothetical protein